MLEKLKNEVFEANLLLLKHNLVTLTWGNVSGIDREKGIVIIKPSGVEYEKMRADDMVLVDFLTGEKLEDGLNPSSDTPTHLELYRRFSNIYGVVHTHSRWATIFAQGGFSVPAFGTTHADYFYGSVPCTRDLSEEEIRDNYEQNTGKVIAETFFELDPMAIPAVLVKSHGPFCWGETSKKAVENAQVLEEISLMAYHNLLKNEKLKEISQKLLDKHYFRKHGINAYYGQQ